MKDGSDFSCDASSVDVRSGGVGAPFSSTVSDSSPPLS